MRPFSLLLLLLLGAAAWGSEGRAISVQGGSFGNQAVLLVRAPAAQPLPPALAARLRLPVSVHWEDVSVAEACEHLARLSGVPIVLDPALRAEGGAGITLSLSAMRTDRVLGWIGTLARVQVTALHGGLFVSRNVPQLPTRLSILPVGDLVQPIRDFPGPELAIAAEGHGARFQPPLDRRLEARSGLDDLAALVEAMAAR